MNMVQTKFTEIINVEKAAKLASLSNKEIKETFWANDEINESGDKWKWSTYIQQLRRFLKIMIANKGKVERTYKYGKNANNGRLYVDYGVGVQSLQHDIKNYLCDNLYYDIDIKNAHPSILVMICENNNIKCDLLKAYVTDRSNILSEHFLTKLDILKAINTDNNKGKRGNDWYNLFISELKRIKDESQTKIPDINLTTENENNPKSSILNKYICKYEGDFLQRVIKFYKDSASVPMFDGLMVLKTFGDSKIDELNKLFTEYKYIEFSLKSMDCAIELPDRLESDLPDYSKAKEAFEKKAFKTIKPHAYWIENKNPDGSFEFNQVGSQDFNAFAQEYSYVEYNKEGILMSFPIMKRWEADLTKRKYECVDFRPYGQTDNCPEWVFNTFDGFECNKILEHTPVDVSNFRTIVNNLCNEFDQSLGSEKSDWLYKYTAHMFQYPEIKPDLIIVLKSYAGSGKDSYFQTIQKMAGIRYVDTTGNCEELFGNFNEFLDSKIAICLNEMEGQNGVKYQERLKELATAVNVKINDKNKKRITQTSYVRPFVFSNNKTPVHIDTSDRRYGVFSAGMDLVGKTDFWDNYYTDLKNKNWIKSLYDELMKVDLNGFNPKKAPITDEKTLMQDKNASPIHRFLDDIIRTKSYNGFDIGKKGDNELYLIKFKVLKQKFETWRTLNGCENYQIKDGTIRQELLSMDNSFTEGKAKINGVRDRCCMINFERMENFLNKFVFKNRQEEPEIEFDSIIPGKDKSNFEDEDETDTEDLDDGDETDMESDVETI